MIASWEARENYEELKTVEAGAELVKALRHEGREVPIELVDEIIEKAIPATTETEEENPLVMEIPAGFEGVDALEEALKRKMDQ
jgi:hypothetical protein